MSSLDDLEETCASTLSFVRDGLYMYGIVCLVCVNYIREKHSVSTVPSRLFPPASV